MCTLIVAHRVVRSAPVVVLANRDEFLARPSLGPAVRDRTPPVFCGLDDKEGGTWFGINAHGVVVGLTNLTLRPPDPALRSRGLVCTDMLGMPSAQHVRQAVEGLDAGAYNPFNLVALDGSTATRVVYDGTPHVEVFEPGVYATTNWPVSSEYDAKRQASEQRVRALLDGCSSLDDVLEGMKQEGRRHDADGDPRASVCCHAPGYGTRASTLVMLDSQGRRVRVCHADGAPCTTSYEDHTNAVADMLAFTGF